MIMLRTLFIFLASAMFIRASSGADFKIVANASVNAESISVDELRRIFLATATSLAGPVHESFLKQCVGKNDAAFNTYYRSLVFTGKASMPKQLSSDEDVASYVARTKGAIGYVSASANTPDVKALQLK